MTDLSAVYLLSVAGLMTADWQHGSEFAHGLAPFLQSLAPSLLVLTSTTRKHWTADGLAPQRHGSDLESSALRRSIGLDGRVFSTGNLYLQLTDYLCSSPNGQASGPNHDRREKERERETETERRRDRQRAGEKASKRRAQRFRQCR
ncbi:hypothetical protein F4859DRAFT_337583 [Xylaria cf. heliscus]|nr:hypothetical protein F4859DRAFT_337583 [Xylaria cf. heliscus]